MIKIDYLMTWLQWAATQIYLPFQLLIHKLDLRDLRLELSFSLVPDLLLRNVAALPVHERWVTAIPKLVDGALMISPRFVWAFELTTPCQNPA